MGLLDNLEDPFYQLQEDNDRSILDLHILESWILTNGKLKTVVYDNRKLFKSVIIRHLIAHNHNHL